MNGEEIHMSEYDDVSYLTGVGGTLMGGGVAT